MTISVRLFRAPGAIRRARYCYDEMTATNQAQLESRLAAGWHLSLAEALEAAGDRAAPHLAGRSVKRRRVAPAQPPQERRASVKRAKLVEVVEAVVAEVAEPDDNAPPTREELVAKAKELKVSFNARTSDETLLERITNALRLRDGL